MAAGWVKSLQCKTRAYEDVYQPKQYQNLLNVTSCRNSYQNHDDVVDVKPKPKPKPKTKPVPKSKPDQFVSKSVKRSGSERSKPKPTANSKTESALSPSNGVRRTVSAPISKGMDPGLVGPLFPSVSELQEGHPSRNVVEIIFHTRWGQKGFAGRVEMVFKVHNAARSTARFEEYRDAIKCKVGPGSGGRCVADGNEMMRFHCLGPTNTMGSCDVVYKIDGGKSATSAGLGLCTFSGSGAAHESAGGGKGRRAMVVCRVIAGRVSKRVGLIGPIVGNGGELAQGFDSMSGENGELLVFDSRAVLPCFLVIYKL